MLGTGSTRVAGIDVAVTEARIDPDGDRTAVAGRGKFAHHSRRANIRQEFMLEHDRERIVAEDVGREANLRRLISAGKSGAQSTERFIARDRVDPDAGILHLAEDTRGRTRFHGEASLHSRFTRHKTDRLDALSNDSR